MTDSKLRELERRWKESGFVGDEIAYLLELVRAGELKHQMLELAAFLGSPGACKALAQKSFDFGQENWPERWTNCLVSFGDETFARAMLVVTRVTLSIWWPPQPNEPNPYDAQSMITLLEQWVGCPCSEHHHLVNRGFDYLHYFWDENGDPVPGAPGTVIEENWTASKLAWAIAHCDESIIAGTHSPDQAQRELAKQVAEELIPWALGYHDPLLDSNDEDIHHQTE